MKYCPKSAELQAAIRNDQTVTDGANVSTYADNTPDDQLQPEAQSETAKKKADEVKAKVEAMKSRRAKKEEAPIPEPEEDDRPVDNGTSEIFTKTSTE